MGVSDPVADAVLAGIAVISADAIICIDEAQRITFFNEGAERIFGYDREEALGQPIELLIPARYRSTHRDHVRRFGQSTVQARRMGERNEISGLRKSGEEFPAEAAISHLGSGPNRVYSVVLRDITFRRRAEQNQRFLAEAGEVLALSLGTAETVSSAARIAVPTLADAAIVSVFHGGTFHGVAAAHVDAPRAEQLQMLRVESPVDLRGSHPVAEVIRTGKVFSIPNSETAEPRLAAMLGESGPIFSDGAAASALVLPLVARDQLLGVMELYTRRRKLDPDDVVLAEDTSRRAALAIDNARLHEQVTLGLRARDDMIGIVSHDLRNPVNAVKMLTGAILGTERSFPLPLDVIEYSTIIRQASEQMDSLIRDLLDVTRIEAGRLKIETAPTDVSDLLSDAFGTLNPIASAKSISLQFSTERGLPMVSVDRERIRQALSNLIGNSVKFSPPESSIDVRAERRDDHVEVSVIDRGPGMNEEQLSHAFDRFWQSRRTDREGAGLGLTITRGIIEAHGGRIWAVSKVGEGSTFHFTLPTTQERRQLLLQPSVP
ncbi:MAG TPA: ATP-binding protein [Gemmatimonadaceae bacterium]|nr:ATP-binding protein [Gemmatimonadaceae bacterium]